MHLKQPQRTVQVNDKLEVVILCPSDCFLQKWQLSLNEGFAIRDFKGPVSDRKANVVETSKFLDEDATSLVIVQYPAAAICAKSFSVIQVFQ